MATNKYLSVDPEEAIHYVSEATAAITHELRKTVIGQDHALEHILITLFAGGHCVLRGIPGIGKTLAVETLGRTLSLKCRRITCTPDLSTDDVTGGVTILEDPRTGQRSSRFIEGPIFANLVLAHEINRTPYRTQMAMLQTLQHLEVSAAGELHTLASPFFFVATINPTEQADVFPLSDALSDRFLMTIPFPCPNADDERRIVQEGTTNQTSVRQILRPSDVLWIQSLARQIPASKHAMDYATDLVRATRPDQSTSPAVVKKWVKQGAGPHAATCLIMAAKARALMKGRCAVHAADIRAVLSSVLLHRLHLRRSAVDEGITPEQVFEWLIQCVPEQNNYGKSANVPPELLVIDNAEYLPPTIETLPQVDAGEPSDWPLGSAGTSESSYELRKYTPSADRTSDMFYGIAPILPTPCGP